jgi:hypothetical protein
MDSPRRLGPYEYKDDLFEAFQLMKAMVEELYHERGKQRIQKDGEGESLVKEEGGGEGGLHNLIHHHHHQLTVKVNILPRISILKNLLILMICHH